MENLPLRFDANYKPCLRWVKKRESRIMSGLKLELSRHVSPKEQITNGHIGVNFVAVFFFFNNII